MNECNQYSVILNDAKEAKIIKKTVKPNDSYHLTNKTGHCTLIFPDLVYNVRLHDENHCSIFSGTVLCSPHSIIE